ncbi:MAG: hypothetical protein PHI03_10765 [Bacteroidales bacterium]|nr:hypothetical protein [Bacteroidales bacterium]
MPHPHRTTTKSLWEVRPTQLINVELKTITVIKIKSFASVALFALATTVLTVFNSGCSKDETIVSTDEMPETEMLVFKDYEEYSSTLTKVLSFNEDELKAWEEAQGFISYGRKCEELFFSQDFESFENLDAFKNFVDNNSQYVELYEELGEYTLDVKYYNCPARYLMNTDRMYQISDTIFKEFTNGVAYVGSSNEHLLKSINGDTFSSTKKAEIGFIESEKKDINMKETIITVSRNGGIARSTTGRNRVRIKIYEERSQNLPYYDIRTVYAEIRPYKRNFGVWIWCERYITGELDWTYSFWGDVSATESLEWNNHLTRFVEVKHSEEVTHGGTAWFNKFYFKATAREIDDKDIKSLKYN